MHTITRDVTINSFAQARKHFTWTKLNKCMVRRRPFQYNSGPIWIGIKNSAKRKQLYE